MLNGRESSKIANAHEWLNYVQQSTDIENISLVILGSEQCNNTWLQDHLVSKSSNPNQIAKFIFIVYDAQDVDDKYFFQWPLGVAT